MNNNLLQNIYQTIYDFKDICKQDIASFLGLSLPTVTQYLKILEDKNLITSLGFSQSTGGRKAKLYQINRTYKQMISVNITRSKLSLSLLDLYRNQTIIKEYDVIFSNTRDYEDFIIDRIKTITNSLSIESIIGVAIAIQGIVSKDYRSVIYGELIGCTNFDINYIEQQLAIKTYLIHDIEANALFHLWGNISEDFIYLSLNENIGGAIVIDNKVYQGKYSPSGIIEHMTIVPDGRLCYCGKNGCLEAYCSQSVIENEYMLPLNAIFANEENKINYLNLLATALNNVHLIMDLPFILCGSIANILTIEDIELLKKITNRKSFYNSQIAIIKIEESPYTTLIGATIPMVEHFLKNIENI